MRLNTGIILILQFQLDYTLDNNNKKKMIMMQATVATQRCPRNETSRWFRTLRFQNESGKRPYA